MPSREPAVPRPVTPRRAEVILVPTCLAVMLVVGGMTSLNLALPDIGLGLGADQAELQWIIDGYALALSALVLPCGALGDRFGRKRMMLAGLVVLLAALAWGASSGSPGELLAARMLAGAGAALVFPATLSTITAVFPATRRGLGIALWAASATIGGIVGLIGSGALVESYWWGSVFVATGAVAVVTLVLTAAFVPNTADPAHAHLDPAGAVLSAAAVGGIVLGVTEGPVRGWSDGLTLAGLAIGIAAAAGFVRWELRCDRPLLDVRVFAHRGFAAGAVVVATQFFAVFGAMFLTVQYLSYVLGYGQLDSGIALAPLGALCVPTALLAEPLARRYGRGRISALGMAISAMGTLLLVPMSAASSYWQLCAGLLVISAGFGLAATPATAAIVGALPAAKQGVASAINDVSRELGGALGIAALGSAFNGPYRARIAASEAIPTDLTGLAKDSVAAGLHTAAGLGEAGAPMAHAVRRAFMHGWGIAMTVATLALTAMTVLVFTRTPKAVDHDLLDETLDLTDPSLDPRTPSGQVPATMT
ncbi:MAG: MFS transporter [Actinomycetota bacterium]|jgi:EmrB/QacA subfamily drug resistance transporter